MKIGKLLGVVALSTAACTLAHAQVTCAECKSTALAEASQCRAQAAPDPALLAQCDKKYAEMGLGCQETACRADAGASAAAQCSDCVKQAEAEVKKCAQLPRDVRLACEARVASEKKSCEDKSCPAAKK
ncbi:MAG TPA: hypothetical protein VF309_08290 [Usitatibacter sp.]